MANELFIPNVGPVQPKPLAGGAESLRESKAGGPAFDKVLQDKFSPQVGSKAPTDAASGLKFSAHAMNRIRDRSINMGGEMMSRLEKAVDSAAAKGSKDSLVLTDDAAFIVSVKNKTVITVLDRNQMNGNVFTNIDSTVLA